MNKRWPQIFSAYLALCLVFAGLAGVSPALHVWLDHGGQGAWHTHLSGGRVLTEAHEHAHAAPQIPAGRFIPATPLARQVSEGPSLTLFGIQPQDIYDAAVGWFAKITKASSPASDSKGAAHTHHSLSQLLLSGAVESAATYVPIVFAPEKVFSESAPVQFRLAPRHWYAPAAARPPPLLG